MLILILVMKVHNGTLHNVVACISSWGRKYKGYGNSPLLFVHDTILYSTWVVKVIEKHESKKI